MSVSGEFIEGPALSAHLEVLFEKLTCPEVLNIATEAQVREMKKWEKMLLLLRPVLEDAEKKQIQGPSVKKWVEEITHLAYDVEDILDEFSTECLRRKVNGERHAAKTSQIRKLIPACFTQQMSEIQEITTRLKGILEEPNRLILDEKVRRTSRSTSLSRMLPVRQPTTSFIPADSLDGRDGERKEILERLFSDEAGDAKVGVIAIVGMGGIGKTTLAQLVYNDDSIRDHFQVRAWVTVSESFDITRISKGILEQVTFQNSDSKELSQVQLQLNQALAGKKFLIVLDDVWSNSYDDWHTLCFPLTDGAPGSKIIVTTRNRDAASLMATVQFQLKPLSDEACWKLFAKYAFESTSILPEEEAIGRQIVSKCKGVPLAAKTLAGLLRGKELNMWYHVNSSMDAGEQDAYSGMDEQDANSGMDAGEQDANSGMDAGEQDAKSRVISALKVSYDHLRSISKRCFIYCAILPKDYEFEKKQIILLWKAEGLIPLSDDGSKVEELGTEIFDDLVSRSFLQFINADETRFTMHDLISDLARKIVGDTCVRFEAEDYVGENSGRARYSSYMQGDLDGIKRLAPFHKMERLRTFLPFSLRSNPVCYLASCVPNVLIERHKYLRVLSFSHCNIKELPNSIGDLKHLRYLDLSYTQIEVLPESTTLLYNLQTLILEECENLRNLPASMDKLINLSHLNIRGVHLIEGMPLEIKQLRGLQMLSNFVIGKGSFSMATLMSLNSLCGEICISNLDYVKSASDARDAKLMEKTGIHNLELTWNTDIYLQDGEAQYEVLHGLQPHSNLKNLIVSDYAGTMLPSWLQDLNNLVHLKLEGCERCTSLPQLGILPKLKELFIIKMSNLQKIDQQFYGSDCSNPFRSLEVLCFRFMDDWEMWNHRELGFRKLRELCIGNCGKLSGKLPVHLPSLEVLVVNDCENLVASLSSLPKLSALEIRNCKEVDFILKDDFSSLNMIVLSNISNIRNLADSFVQRLKKFKNLTMSCESNFTMTVPSSSRQYGGVITKLECVFQKLPQLMSIIVDEDKVQLQMELGRSEVEVVTLREFKKLPAWIQKLKFLRELTIEGCQVTSPGALPSILKVLSVIDCNVFDAFSDLIVCNRQSLQELELCGCDFLTSFGRGQLPPTLKKLSIVDCKNLKSLFEEDECESSSFSTDLEDLFISGCDNLTSISYIPEGKLLSKLQCLEISSCKRLESIVERFDLSIPLELMYICDCRDLKSLPEGLHNLVKLREFEISGCLRIVSFPKGGLPTSLITLEIRDLEKLEAFPDNLHTLSSLQELHISNCTSLVSFPSGGLPTNLTTFSIKNVRICKAMFEWGLDQLNSLSKLDIEGGCTEVASFPPDETEVEPPQHLTHLAIRDFPNLERFSTRFQDLTCLRSLTLWNCPKLASFPENGLLDILLQLDVRNCPMLEKLWQEGGQGQLWWSKIRNIPKFEISDT